MLAPFPKCHDSWIHYLAVKVKCQGYEKIEALFEPPMCRAIVTLEGGLKPSFFVEI